MTKTLGSILTFAISGPIGLIDKRAGQIVSGVVLTAIGIISGNPIALALGLSQLAGAFAPGPPKPETTESQVKTSRPPRVSAYGESRLFGAYILFETADNGSAVDVYAVHDGLMDGVVAWYLNDEEIELSGNTVQEGDDGRYRDNAVKLYWTDGSDPGAGLPAITSLVPEWDGRGDGVVLMALTAKSVKTKHFQETYPNNGVPTPSLAARWQLCPDPAALDPTNEALWTWTENPVRHLLHYKMVREGVDFAARIEPAIAFWIAAAEDCEDPTELAAGGTEDRYRSCVAHKHTDQHKGVVANLLSTFDGWMSPRADGALIVYSGRYYEPTVSIGPEEIVAYTWDGVGVDDDEAINEIVVSYVSAEHNYNTVEGDAWRDEADISARGQVLSTPLEAQVPSFPQARRLAKRKMARIMAPSRGTVTTNVAGRIVRGERYINLTIEEAGTTFYDGPAEIVALTRNMTTGGVTFQWVAADPDIDDWDPEIEEGQGAVLGERVPSAPLTAPVITSAIFFGTDNSSSGTTGARIRVTITGPDREDLTWFARWRTEGAATWGGDLEFTDVDPGPSVVIETDFVPSDDNVEVQVAYQVGDGRFSAWSDTAVVDTGSITFDDTGITFDATDISWDRT